MPRDPAGARALEGCLLTLLDSDGRVDCEALWEGFESLASVRAHQVPADVRVLVERHQGPEFFDALLGLLFRVPQEERDAANQKIQRLQLELCTVRAGFSLSLRLSMLDVLPTNWTYFFYPHRIRRSHHTLYPGARLASPSMHGLVRELIQDASPEVRQEAVRILALMFGRVDETIETLAHISLHDEDEDVRQEALWFLWMLRYVRTWKDLEATDALRREILAMPARGAAHRNHLHIQALHCSGTSSDAEAALEHVDMTLSAESQGLGHRRWLGLVDLLHIAQPWPGLQQRVVHALLLHPEREFREAASGSILRSLKRYRSASKEYLAVMLREVELYRGEAASLICLPWVGLSLLPHLVWLRAQLEGARLLERTREFLDSGNVRVAARVFEAQAMRAYVPKPLGEAWCKASEAENDLNMGVAWREARVWVDAAYATRAWPARSRMKWLRRALEGKAHARSPDLFVVLDLIEELGVEARALLTTMRRVHDSPERSYHEGDACWVVDDLFVERLGELLKRVERHSKASQ